MTTDINAELARIVGADNLLTGTAARSVYDYDASLCRGMPDAVAFVRDTGQVARLVRLCGSRRLPYVARGSGTNLSGGSVLRDGGLVIDLCRMNRILDIDIATRTALVEPGVINLDLQESLAPHGFFYAPDPASHKVSTMGGNLAENSGGPRCLKYGVTSNHMLGAEVVRPDGRVVWWGGAAADAPGPDLMGLLVGSEGTLGIATRIRVRILPLPEDTATILAVFDSLPAAGRAVAGIIATGLVPAALEIMDRLVIQAVEDSIQAGYPRDAAAVLIVELDGPADGLADQAREVIRLCRPHTAGEPRLATDAHQREELWRGRRGAFGAIARLAPNFLVCDATVPPSRLPDALQAIQRVAGESGLPIGNVFHAGDGNLHPLILFDARVPGTTERVHRVASRILAVCVELGGTISGEHGIGIEKQNDMHLLFTDTDLAIMQTVKQALDPHGLANPGKIFPAAGAAA